MSRNPDHKSGWARWRARLTIPEDLDITLRFRDRTLDARFEDSWMRATRPINQIWACIGLAVYLAMTLITQANISSDMTLWFTLRLFVGLPLGLLSLAYLFLHGRHLLLSAFLYMLSSSLIFQFSLWQLHFSEPADSIFFLCELIVILAFAQHYHRVMFRWNLIFTLANGAIAYVAISGMAPDPAIAPSSLLLSLGAIAMIGLFANHAREIQVRRNYAVIQQLKAEKRQVEALAVESSQASEAKSRFLAVISHELRTPLNAVVGYVEMIRSGMAQRLGDGKVEEYLGYIHDSGRNQLELVNTLLEITRNELGDGTQRSAPVDLAAHLRAVIAQVTPRAMDLNCTLNLDVPATLPDLHCDPDQLRQMVSNLINNGVKFSKQAGRVDVSAWQRDDGGLSIAVVDEGMGIAAEQIDDVIQPFTQLSGRDRRNDGLGIGLPLTKSLIEAHGGRLTIDSRENEGTRVCLEFPPERTREKGAVMKNGEAC